MQKIDSLRDAILKALPELRRDRDRIKIWVERGSAKATQTPDQSFAFGFQLNVLIVEMRSDIAVLAHAVFHWLRANQPELIVPGAQGFTFDADYLDNRCADVELQLQLDQAVKVTKNAEGKFDLDYRAEPDPLFDDALAIVGDDAVTLTGFEADEDLPPWNP